MKSFITFFLSIFIVSVSCYLDQNELSPRLYRAIQRRALQQRWDNLYQSLYERSSAGIWEDDDQLFYSRAVPLSSMGSGELKENKADDYWVSAPAPPNPNGGPTQDAIMRRPGGQSYSAEQKVGKPISDERMNEKTRQLAKDVQKKYQNSPEEQRINYKQDLPAKDNPDGSKSPAVHSPRIDQDTGKIAHKNLPMSTGQMSGKGKNQKYDFQSQSRPFNQPDHGPKGQKHLDQSTNKQAQRLYEDQDDEKARKKNPQGQVMDNHTKGKGKINKTEGDLKKHQKELKSANEQKAALEADFKKDGVDRTNAINKQQQRIQTLDPITRQEEQKLKKLKGQNNEREKLAKHGNGQACPECKLTSQAADKGRQKDLSGGRQVAYGTRPDVNKDGRDKWGPQDACAGGKTNHGCSQVQKDNGMKATTDKARDQEANRRNKNQGGLNKQGPDPNKKAKGKTGPPKDGENYKPSNGPGSGSKKPLTAKQRAAQEKKQQKAADYQDKQTAKQDKKAEKNSQKPKTDPKELPPNKKTPQQKAEKQAKVDKARAELKDEVAKNKAADKAREEKAKGRTTPKSGSDNAPNGRKSPGPGSSGTKPSSSKPASNKPNSSSTKPNSSGTKETSKTPTGKKIPGYMAGTESSKAKQKPKIAPGAMAGSAASKPKAKSDGNSPSTKKTQPSAKAQGKQPATNKSAPSSSTKPKAAPSTKKTDTKPKAAPSTKKTETKAQSQPKSQPKKADTPKKADAPKPAPPKKSTPAPSAPKSNPAASLMKEIKSPSTSIPSISKPSSSSSSSKKGKGVLGALSKIFRRHMDMDDDSYEMELMIRDMLELELEDAYLETRSMEYDWEYDFDDLYY